MRAAIAVSKNGRLPKSYMPWLDAPTRSFADFKKAHPYMFQKKAKS